MKLNLSILLALTAFSGAALAIPSPNVLTPPGQAEPHDLSDISLCEPFRWAYDTDTKKYRAYYAEHLNGPAGWQCHAPSIEKDRNTIRLLNANSRVAPGNPPTGFLNGDVNVPQGKLPDGYTKDTVGKSARLICDYNICGWVLIWEFKGVEWPHMYSERIDQELAKAALEQEVAVAVNMPTR